MWVLLLYYSYLLSLSVSVIINLIVAIFNRIRSILVIYTLHTSNFFLNYYWSFISNSLGWPIDWYQQYYFNQLRHLERFFVIRLLCSCYLAYLPSINLQLGYSGIRGCDNWIFIYFSNVIIRPLNDDVVTRRWSVLISEALLLVHFHLLLLRQDLMSYYWHFIAPYVNV